MLTLLIGILLIVFVTFGGGAVFIPMFENLLVEQLGIFPEAEFTTLIGLVNSFSGPTGGKIAGYAGYYVNGWLGFILASLVFILPGTLLMLIALKFVSRIKDSKIMKKISIYIKPIVIGIFLSIIVKFLRLSFEGVGYHTVIVFLVSFYLLDRRKVQPVFVIILSLIYGIIISIPF